MTREQFRGVLFLALAVVIFYLFYQVMAPFFAPIAYAAVFAIVFHPFYDWLLSHLKRPNLTALIVCATVTIVIVGPMVYLLTTLVGEAKAALEYLTQMYDSGELARLAEVGFPGLNALKEQLGKYTDPENLTIEALAVNAVSVVSGLLKDQLTTVIANTGRTVFYFGIMLFSMFFFFRDAGAIVQRCCLLIPLKEEQVRKAAKNLKSVVEATIFGGVVVALLQGLAGGILFASVGIPSAVFWGAMMAFLSFLPIVGAFLVFLPAALILIVGGSLVKGLVVLLIGALIISQIDSFVRPWLIAGKTSMHTLLLFLSILGGITLFGLLGIVMGPVIAALMVTLIRILEERLNPPAGESSDIVESEAT